MKFLALMLLTFASLSVRAGEIDCDRLKHSLEWFDYQIMEQEDATIRGERSQTLVELDKLIEMRDLFEFWSGRYIQSCKPKEAFDGPPRRRMKHIG